MKTLVFLFLLMQLVINMCGQDVIVKSNGETIYGKIIKEDSVRLFLKTNPDGYETTTEFEKRKLKTIIYNYKSSDELLIKLNKDDNTKKKIDEDDGKKSAISIGFLNGGGSLLGFDMELLLTKNFGFQLGGGFVGYGAGLNLHFSPKINSSFLSFQYWHQGIKNSYTQSLIGPSVVFRAKKYLAAQLGLAYVLEHGPAWPTDVKTSPVILTYSIGLYFPFKAN